MPYRVRRDEYLFSEARSLAAISGGFAPLPSICLLVHRWPYMAWFSSMSLRSVAPSSEMPAKTPRERDQERISAFIRASVWAEVLRPTGPAAAVASAPMVNLLLERCFIPPSFITGRTTSVEETPIWKPTLPPSMRMAAGGPQPGPLGL